MEATGVLSFTTRVKKSWFSNLITNSGEKDEVCKLYIAV